MSTGPWMEACLGPSRKACPLHRLTAGYRAYSSTARRSACWFVKFRLASSFTSFDASSPTTAKITSAVDNSGAPAPAQATPLLTRSTPACRPAGSRKQPYRRQPVRHASSRFAQADEPALGDLAPPLLSRLVKGIARPRLRADWDAEAASPNVLVAGRNRIE